MEQYQVDLLRADLLNAQDRHQRLPAGTVELTGTKYGQLIIPRQAQADRAADACELAVIQGV